MKQLEKKVIGTKSFGPKMDITDPWYDKNVYWRMNDVEIAAGEYSCIIWTHTDSEATETYEVIDADIGKIGIYLDGIIPPAEEMSVLGMIGTNSGLAGFFTDKPDYTPEEWRVFCNSIKEGIVWIKPEGFFSFTGYGSGSFVVCASKNAEGIITAVEIVF